MEKLRRIVFLIFVFDLFLNLAIRVILIFLGAYMDNLISFATDFQANILPEVY